MYIAIISFFDAKKKMFYDDNLEYLFELINLEVDKTKERLMYIIDTESICFVEFQHKDGKYVKK